MDGDDLTRAKEHPRVFFIHIMKTAGTSFSRYLERVVPAPERYPRAIDREQRRLQYYMVDALRSHHANDPSTWLYAGHFPFVAAELVDADVTMTILRDPVDRIVSAIHHFRQWDPRLRDLPLEAIYEDSFTYDFYLHDHQVKMFAMERDDPLESHMDIIDVDDARLTIAKRNLENVDLLGLTARYDDFVERVRSRFGWPAMTVGRHRVTAERFDVSRVLMRRIVTDNAADIDFYNHALEVHGKD